MLVKVPCPKCNTLAHVFVMMEQEDRVVICESCNEQFLVRTMLTCKVLRSKIDWKEVYQTKDS
jgi:transcription elongation factor Elf1